MSLPASSKLIPPQNLEAEESVLGAMIISPRVIPAIVEHLQEDHFYLDSQRRIFRSILDLFHAGQPVDLITVTQHLTANGFIDQVGGKGYIHFLVSTVPVVSNAPHYAEIIKKNAVLREGRIIGQKLAAGEITLTEARENIDKLEASSTEGLVRVAAGELKETSKSSLDYIPVLGRKDIVVKGWSHLLAAYPKVGKTEFICSQIDEWVKSFRILCLTEENESIWADRLKNRAWEGVNFVYALGTTVEEIASCIRAGNEDVVIIDTVRAALGIEQENDNSEVARKLTPVIQACREKNKTLFLLHHARKGGGESGEAISGGHAYFGAVDIALELKRDKQAPSSSKRILNGLGRRISIPEVLFERSDDGSYSVLGSPNEVALEEVMGRVFEVLTDDWQKAREITEALGDPQPSREQVRRALGALVKKNLAERDPAEDRQRATYKWRLPA